MSYILGISAHYHDSACVLLNDQEIVAAAQEERFTRIKHDPSFPKESIKYCLEEANITLEELSYIAFYDKPLIKFERLIETYVAFAPRGFKSFCKSMPIWLKEKLFQKKVLLKEIKNHDINFDNEDKIFFSDHHLSHAASAFFPSPFEEAVVLTADGVGEWATTTVAVGKASDLEIKKEIHFPHSLGLLYSAFTYYAGFKVNSGEYKLMGLAPYGNPIYEEKVKQLIDIKDDGTFRLNQKYFNYATGLTMTNDKFDKLFGQKVRDSKVWEGYSPEDVPDDYKWHYDRATKIDTARKDEVTSMDLLDEGDRFCMGDPDDCIRYLEKYEELGIDEIMPLFQVGPISHEEVMETLRLFDKYVIPYFKQKSKSRTIAAD